MHMAPRRGRTFAGRVGIAAVVLVAAMADIVRGQAAPAEPALWAELSQWAARPDGRDFGPDWFAQAAASRQRMLERIQLYQVLYPGGPHRDDVIVLELQTRFELATLQNDFDSLRDRLRELSARPPSPAAAEEVAFWTMMLPPADAGAGGAPRDAAGLGGAAAGSQPAAGAMDIADEARRAPAYRAFVEAHPRSRHVPRLALQLFRWAETRGEYDELPRLVDLLRRGFPDHGVTVELAARARLYAQRGNVMTFSAKTRDGRVVDSRDLRGQPLRIVFWSIDSAASIERVASVAAECASVGGRLIVVNIDAEAGPAMEVANRERWRAIEIYDGASGPLGTQWGIGIAPFVLELDAAGRLQRAGE
jgi:hypothetical protein